MANYEDMIMAYNPGFYLGADLPKVGDSLFGMPVVSISNATQGDEGIDLNQGHVVFGGPTTLPRGTVTLWVKYSPGSPRGLFSGERGAYDFSAGPWLNPTHESIIHCGNQSGSFFTNTRFPANAWRHVAIVRRGTTSWDAYVNGVLAGSGSENTNYRFGATVTVNELILGGTDRAPHANSMQGTLAGVAFLPQVLTAGQIQALSNAGPPKPADRWTVLESGLEVPMTLEGEKVTVQIDAPAYGSQVVGTTNVSKTNMAPVTMSMWAKKPVGTLQTFHGLFSHQSGTALGNSHNVIINYTTTNADSHLYMNGAYRAGFDRGILDDNEFHHFVYVADARNAALYVDGKAVVTTTGGDEIALDTLNFGQAVSGTNLYTWNGPIANFAMWDEEFDAAQVAGLYGAGLGVNYGLPISAVRQLTGPVIYMAPKRRQYDIEQFFASTDAASDVVEMVTATDPFEDAYGLKLTAMISSASRNGYTGDAVDINDPLTKQGFKVFIDELAKYPSSFIAPANVGQLALITNLAGSSGTHVRGVAFVSDMYGSWMNVDTNQGHVRHRGTWISSLRFTFHHELMHLLSKRYENDWNAMEAEWVSHNSTAYIGSAWETQEKVIHPAGGFFRDYSMHSYREDMADVLAAVMVSHIQPEVENLIAIDPAIAAKVQMVKRWLAKMNPMFGDPNYWTMIHSD